MEITPIAPVSPNGTSTYGRTPDVRIERLAADLAVVREQLDRTTDAVRDLRSARTYAYAVAIAYVMMAVAALVLVLTR